MTDMDHLNEASQVTESDVSYTDDSLPDNEVNDLKDPEFLADMDAEDAKSTSLPPADLSLLFDEVPSVATRKGVTGTVTASPPYNLSDAVDELAEEIQIQGDATRLTVAQLAKKIDALVAVLKESGSLTVSAEDVADLQTVVTAQRAFINMVLKMVPSTHSAAIAQQLASMSEAHNFQAAQTRLMERERRRRLAMNSKGG